MLSPAGISLILARQHTGSGRASPGQALVAAETDQIRRCVLQDLPEHVRFIPGVPVKPMLAKPTTGISEVLDKFTDQEFTCEYK